MSTSMTGYEACKLAIARRTGIQKKLKQERKEANQALSVMNGLIKYTSVYHTTGEMVSLSLARKCQKILKKITEIESRLGANKIKIWMLEFELEDLNEKYKAARKAKGE